jgi:hypothetical protein
MSSDIFRPENNSKCFKIKLIAYKFFLTEFIGTPYDGIKIFTDNPIIIKGNAEKIIFKLLFIYFYFFMNGNRIRL